MSRKGATALLETFFTLLLASSLPLLLAIAKWLPNTLATFESDLLLRWMEPWRISRKSGLPTSPPKTLKTLQALVSSLARRTHPIGVVITPEQVRAAVSAAIDACKAALVAERYRFNAASILANVKNDLKWADGKTVVFRLALLTAKVKEELDAQVLALLGPKTEADDPKNAPKVLAQGFK